MAVVWSIKISQFTVKKKILLHNVIAEKILKHILDINSYITAEEGRRLVALTGWDLSGLGSSPCTCVSFLQIVRLTRDPASRSVADRLQFTTLLWICTCAAETP